MEDMGVLAHIQSSARSIRLQHIKQIVQISSFKLHVSGGSMIGVSKMLDSRLDGAV
jgi:hypothetical protein